MSTSKNILDILNFDITQFFKKPHIEVGIEDMPAIQVVDYEAKLTEKEFDIFDTIRLRVLFDKNNLTGETHVNVSFRSKKRRTTKQEAIQLVNYITSIYGADNNNKHEWNEEDDKAFDDFCLNRVWATGLGENFISIHVKEVTGLEFNILFANNLLKNMGKKIDF